VTAEAHDHSDDDTRDKHGYEDDTCFVSFAHDGIEYLHPENLEIICDKVKSLKQRK